MLHSHNNGSIQRGELKYTSIQWQRTSCSYNGKGIYVPVLKYEMRHKMYREEMV